MNDQMWAIKQVHIRKTPGNGATVTYAPAGSLLRWTGKREMASTSLSNGGYADAFWMEVEFTSFWGRSFTGWTYEGWLEAVAEPAPVDPINEVVPILDTLRTPDPFDAQQYLVLGGKAAHNLCPHFCAAYMGGDPIVSFLGKAQRLSPAAWNAGVVKDTGLGISALETMIEDVYGFEMMRFAEGVDDPFVGTLVSPGKMREMLDRGWMLIAGVKINGANGKLISSGRIGHWVVLTGVQPYGVNEGQVEIYNPFPNRYQTLPYSDFVSSMKAWHRGGLAGLWVPSHESFQALGDGETDFKDAPESGVIALRYAEQKLREIDAFIESNAAWIGEQKTWIDAQKKALDLE